MVMTRFGEGPQESFSCCTFQNEIFRSRLEDAYFIDRNQEWCLYAIADGFSKDDGRGLQVVESVIGAVSENLGLFARNLDAGRSLAELFALVDDRTKDELSGSTLAVAFRDLRSPDLSEYDVWSGALGDTYVASLDAAGRLLLNPYEHAAGLGRNLWGCFGDRENRHAHSQVPEIRLHKLTPGSALYLASDGAAATDDFGALEARAKRDLEAILSGKAADYIVAEAVKFRHSTDNITVLAETL